MAASTFDTDVLVAGAGPTGLTTAIALRAAGVDALVIDAAADGSDATRAVVVHAHTLEVLKPLGVTEALIARGDTAESFDLYDHDRLLVRARFDQLPTEFPFSLVVPQPVTEAVLRDRLTRLGGRVRRPAALTDFVRDDAGVTAVLDDGSRLRARYLVGADGIDSAVRRLSGIAFPGSTYRESFVVAEVSLSGGASRQVRYFHAADGPMTVVPLPNGHHRVAGAAVGAPSELDRAYLQRMLDARGPRRAPVTIDTVHSSSRYRVHHKVAARLRAGRALLAGDAAHVHSPAGGQGMNLGIQDAVALGSALAAVLDGGADSVLDDYAERRHAMAVRVTGMTDRLTRRAMATGPSRAVRNLVMRVAANLPPVNRAVAWQLSGLGNRDE